MRPDGKIHKISLFCKEAAKIKGELVLFYTTL